MPYHHPYKPNNPDDEPRGQQRRTAYTGMPDLDDALHDVVQTGTGLGAEVLGAVGSALRSVGEALAGNKLTNKNVPFPTWRKRLDHFLKEEKHTLEEYFMQFYVELVLCAYGDCISNGIFHYGRQSYDRRKSR